MSTVRSSGPSAFIRTNVQGTFTLLEQARAYWSGLDEAERRQVPVSARVHGRGLRDAGPGRSRVLRNHAVCAEQPLCGIEGRFRSPGAGLSPHLRTARADHELLEQLRPVSVSGKADPADDSECARRQGPAGVWRRRKRARLALRGRSLRGDPRRAGARAASAKPTTSAETASATISMW